ncbi:hypothetical protein CYMTET_51776 [Cymbomonas tetramitiformis]|uniref:Telomeric single stranded DNA binding POT1/Cdc13 domain-containing protein n=1 Tax=Cymbomonas tetramitiformis TaxID=36881 RepID=A0AAE0BM82_9CHLO|nr:hypothetical protein CYMTET_51776 [Cymbomonas tetramitiformis]
MFCGTFGKDLMCTMTIVDSSTYCVHDGGTSGLDVRLFFSKEEDRPHPRARCGDIIRFHRLKVESYKGTCSLVGKVGKYCHFLMFDGACETETPYQASSPTYTLTNVDKISLERLRTWIRSLNLSSLRTYRPFFLKSKDVEVVFKGLDELIQAESKFISFHETENSKDAVLFS